MKYTKRNILVNLFETNTKLFQSIFYRIKPTSYSFSVTSFISIIIDINSIIIIIILPLLLFSEILMSFHYMLSISAYRLSITSCQDSLNLFSELSIMLISYQKNFLLSKCNTISCIH